MNLQEQYSLAHTIAIKLDNLLTEMDKRNIDSNVAQRIEFLTEAREHLLDEMICIEMIFEDNLDKRGDL